MITSGSPGRHRPAAISRCATSRSWAAVTSAASSSGPIRTASSSTCHDDAPGPSADTSEYGHPGTICPALRPRPCTWQNIRPGLAAASGRSHPDTSTASRIPPSAHAGSGSPDTAARSRPNATSPAPSASYSAPWPRRNSGTSDSRARSLTRPPAHSTASHNSNSASARASRHEWNSRRNPARATAASPPETPPPRTSQDIMKATATARLVRLTSQLTQTMTDGGRFHHTTRRTNPRPTGTPRHTG
jgi:hypothetical protein